MSLFVAEAVLAVPGRGPRTGEARMDMGVGPGLGSNGLNDWDADQEIQELFSTSDSFWNSKSAF